MNLVIVFKKSEQIKPWWTVVAQPGNRVGGNFVFTVTNTFLENFSELTLSGFLRCFINRMSMSVAETSCLEYESENIEWFIEDQAFTASHDLAPPQPPSPPLPSLSCPSVSLFLCVTGQAYWRAREDGGGAGAKSYDGEKALSSINHSILSDMNGPWEQKFYSRIDLHLTPRGDSKQIVSSQSHLQEYDILKT